MKSSTFYRKVRQARISEINYGRIEIESDHNPNNDEIIEKILEGNADYNDTDFTDFCLIEINGETQHSDNGGTDPPSSFEVTITETLQKVVTIEAEQMVSDNWRDSEYVLGADNFAGVEFEAVPAIA